MIARFHTLKPLTTVPDNASYSILDSTGRLVLTSETNSVTAVQTATGAQFAIDYDVPDLDPGSYVIVFDVDGNEFNTEFSAGAGERVEDAIVTLNRTINLDLPAPTGTWTLYKDNTPIGNGSFSGGNLTTQIAGLQGLDSSLLVIQDSSGAVADYEVFSITPTLLKAIRELKGMIDRLQRELRLDALEMRDIDYLRFMVRGRDRFNALHHVTNFTMTNAQGAIRGAWLTMSAMEAMRARSLEEGISSYDYQGAGVSLAVDARAAIDEWLLMMEARIADEYRPLKADLAKMGAHGGDGSQVMGGRAVGSVGITLGPAVSGGYGAYNRSRYPRM